MREREGDGARCSRVPFALSVFAMFNHPLVFISFFQLTLRFRMAMVDLRGVPVCEKD